MRGAKALMSMVGGFAAMALTGAAEAGFTFNYTVTPGTGDLAGKNVFNFYALNDQKGEQYGSKSLLVMEVTFQSLGSEPTPFLFDFRDVDGDGLADANVFGKDFDETSARSTFQRIGSYAEWLSVLPRENTYSTKAGANPQQSYGNVSSFQVTGFSTNKGLDATQGMGRYFGTAVLAQGVDVRVFGKVAAEVGGIAEPELGAAAGAAPDEGAPSLVVTDPELAAEIAAGSSPDLPIVMAGAGMEPGTDFFFEFVARAPEPAGMLAVAGLGMVVGMRRRRN